MSPQSHYNLVFRDTCEGELEDLARRASLAVVPYYALTSGFLTSKYQPGPPQAPGPAGPPNCRPPNVAGASWRPSPRSPAPTRSPRPPSPSPGWRLAPPSPRHRRRPHSRPPPCPHGHGRPPSHHRRTPPPDRRLSLTRRHLLRALPDGPAAPRPGPAAAFGSPVTRGSRQARGRASTDVETSDRTADDLREVHVFDCPGIVGEHGRKAGHAFTDRGGRCRQGDAPGGII